MKLYLAHCGYYDNTGYGIYESHTNFFVVAEDEKKAKAKAKNLPAFIDKKMHIDGLQEIDVVDGYQVQLKRTDSPVEVSHVISYAQDEI